MRYVYCTHGEKRFHEFKDKVIAESYEDGIMKPVTIFDATAEHMLECGQEHSLETFFDHYDGISKGWHAKENAMELKND